MVFPLATSVDSVGCVAVVVVFVVVVVALVLTLSVAHVDAV